jgi:hypothetical protein
MFLIQPVGKIGFLSDICADQIHRTSQSDDARYHRLTNLIVVPAGWILPLAGPHFAAVRSSCSTLVRTTGYLCTSDAAQT